MESLGSDSESGPDPEPVPMRDDEPAPDAPSSSNPARGPAHDHPTPRRASGGPPDASSRMPVCDMLRFQHIKGIASAGGLVSRAYSPCSHNCTRPTARRSPPLCHGRPPYSPDKGYIRGIYSLGIYTKEGINDHRPIGAGTAWRRIVAGFLQSKAQQRNLFKPLQLGVGTSRASA